MFVVRKYTNYAEKANVHCPRPQGGDEVYGVDGVDRLCFRVVGRSLSMYLCWVSRNLLRVIVEIIAKYVQNLYLCINQYSTTMSYKLGFFYNLPFSFRHSNRLIVAFDYDHLTFRRIQKELLPRMNSSNMSYYSFDYPILYTEDHSGEISSISFLSDIPVRYNTKIEGKGLELFVPFWGLKNPQNACVCINDYLRVRTQETAPFVQIFDNGKELFTLPDFLFRNRLLYDDNLLDVNPASLFYRSVITYSILSRIVNSIRSNAKRFSVFSVLHDYSPFDNMYKVIHGIKDYVNSFEIEDLLQDLEVEVSEHFRHKIGDDDSYSVHRQATLSSPIANNDNYLKNLIGIGGTQIYSDSGYCSAESMRLENLITGKYTGQILEDEKQKIISSYSKEEHLGYILSDLLSIIIRNYSEVDGWNSFLITYRDFLINVFHVDALSNKDRSFEHNFYPIESSYCDNPQDILDELNVRFKDSTTYTLKSEFVNNIIRCRFKDCSHPVYFSDAKI